MERFGLFFLRKWGNFENKTPDGDGARYYHWNKMELSKQQEKLLQFPRSHMGRKQRETTDKQITK